MEQTPPKILALLTTHSDPNHLFFKPQDEPPDDSLTTLCRCPNSTQRQS